MTFKVGITGDIASGKSTVSAYLKEKGYRLIDADAISRHLTRDHAPILPEIEAAFPGVTKEGKLLRSKLGAIVFSDPAQRERLNALLHPPIRKRIQEEMQEGGRVVFLDAPLLFEGGYDALMDIVLYLAIDEETQLSRLQKRDGLTREEALARMRAFDIPREEKMVRSYVLDNRGTLEELLAQVDIFLTAFEL